jgi:hypothetical protein
MLTERGPRSAIAPSVPMNDGSSLPRASQSRADRPADTVNARQYSVQAASDGEIFAVPATEVRIVKAGLICTLWRRSKMHPCVMGVCRRALAEGGWW